MFTDPEKLYQHLVSDPSEIRKFVKETPESHILDYKSWSSLKKPAAGTGEKRLSNVVCSFANTGGGVILFGVCDSPRKLEKHEFSEDEIENLQNVLSRQVNPPLWFAKHQTVDVGEKSEVLLLFVPASRHIHQVREDMCIYVRRASTSRKADIHEIGALYADRPQLVQLTKGIEEAGKNLPDTTGHFTQGVALREEHEYGQAIAEFNECIRLNQSNTEAYIQRGFTRACLGDFDGAMADIDRVIEIDPRNAGAYSTRGYLYGDVGDFESAEEADTKVIEILPDNAEGYHNRAIVRDAMGDLKGAIEDFNKALKLATDDEVDDIRKSRKNVAVEYRRQLLEEELEHFKKGVVENLDPELILVYGSYAKRDITERSDLDVVVVFKSDKDFWPRQFLLGRLKLHNVGMDSTGYTPEEWEKRKKSDIFTKQEILPHMKIIYSKGEKSGGETE